MEIRKLNSSEPVPYNLLLLADPSIEALEKYLDRNYIFVALIEGIVVGVFALYPLDADSIEIKNIAVDENYQGQGIATAMLGYATTVSRDKGYRRLVIGTADISSSPIPLYQKNGFEIYDVKKNFFIDNYAEPIFDNGEQCVDMVMLGKPLT
ncbi:GNAT family N-acetyltransferase [Prevotella sp. 10(H)]|uniref:GNAT family N-acetyltransferase n=1 Tax=Prevotella sp. 10(H) TaxID=1158294 RepID=UPI0004A77851|nr:GNAT family N-acetyltransferase [Prevotella sp. 10(H)]